MRKTKVRIVGDPILTSRVDKVIQDHFETVDRQEFDTAVGRDHDHSQSPGCTIYLTVKKEKEASP